MPVLAWTRTHNRHDLARQRRLERVVPELAALRRSRRETNPMDSPHEAGFV
jgi:hypothetical protein